MVDHKIIHRPSLLTASARQLEIHAVEANSYRQIAMLNQQKMKRLPKSADPKQTLQLLGECYPHFSLSSEAKIPTDCAPLSYEASLNILYEHDENVKIANMPGRIEETLIVDGKFLTSVIDRVRSSCNAIPIALCILRLSVHWVQHNCRIRSRFKTEDQSFTEHRLKSEGVKDLNAIRQIYKAVVSLLGQSNNVSDNVASRLILHFLHKHMPMVTQIEPEPEIYHAALNSLGRRGESNELLNLLEGMERSYKTRSCNKYPPVDQMAYQTAISSLSKHGNTDTALSILHHMKATEFLPDVNCYNVLLIGLAKEAGRANNLDSDRKVHEVALQMLQEMELQNLNPSEQAYNSVISACCKDRAWREAAKIEWRETLNVSSGIPTEIDLNETPNRITQNNSSAVTSKNQLATYFRNLECYKKVGKGKDSWWEIGQCIRNGTSIIIGIHPHRNPVRNGLSLVFYHEGMKLGRLLLKNSSLEKVERGNSGSLLYSSIVGMEVDESHRGQGLSKLFIAIWLQCCLSIGAYPRAAMMNKPLISLVLIQFGFIPNEGGTCCELIRLSNRNKQFAPKFGLYSSSKTLQGVFSERVLRSQNIAILDHASLSTRSEASTIYIKTTFEHPVSVAENAVDYNPPAEISKELKCQLDSLDADQHPASQRRILEDKLHHVIGEGRLNFFSSLYNLQLAFISQISIAK
eukprot:scaffold53590_cov95-Cyclotella_meneghiniana.AAC.1